MSSDVSLINIVMSELGGDDERGRRGIGCKVPGRKIAAHAEIGRYDKNFTLKNTWS